MGVGRFLNMCKNIFGTQPPFAPTKCLPPTLCSVCILRICKFIFINVLPLAVDKGKMAGCLSHMWYE